MDPERLEQLSAKERNEIRELLEGRKPGRNKS